MPIVVTCPSCKAKLKAPETLIGKKVKCPGCQTPVLVPAQGAAPAPAPAPAPARQAAVAKAPVKKPVEDDLDDEDEAPARPSARKSAPPPEDDFEDLDEAPPVKGKGKKPAPRDEDEEDERPAPKKKGKPAAEEDDFEDLDEAPPAKGKGKKVAARDEDEDEDDRPAPKKKGKKGKSAVTVPDEETSEQDRNNAFIFYVALLVGSLLQVGPLGGLVWWFMKKGESKFVDYTGKQWLNYAITTFVYALGLIAVIVLGVTLMAVLSDVWYLGLGVMLLGFLGVFALGLYSFILQIMAMFKVKAGVWYRYPMAWQLLK